MADSHDPFCPQAVGGVEEFYQCSCPLIREVRADEREKVKAEYVPVLMEHLRREAGFSDLRAKVEALRPWLSTSSPLMLAVSRADVLALFDGSGE